MSMKKMYPYAVGRISAIENSLLSYSKLEALAMAKSADECIKQLIDAGYKPAENFEQMLQAESDATYELLRSLTDGERIFDIFLYKNDCHNIKVIIKDMFLGTNSSSLLSKSGTLEPDLLREIIFDKKFELLPGAFAKAAEEAVSVFSKTKDPQAVSVIIDRACYEMMLRLAKESKNEFLTELVRIMIDLTNIKTFHRLRKMKKNQDAFLDGGKIEKSVFFEKLSAEEMNFPGYPFAGGEQSLAELEKKCDDFIVEFIKKAKYTPLTIEPLVAYLVAKENEIKALRIILSGKINQIPPEEIKERLRESYV